MEINKNYKNIWVDNDGNYGAKKLFQDHEASLAFIQKLKKLINDL